MGDVPKLGQLCDPSAGRDAVHVAIAPVVAGWDLTPGQHVGLVETTEGVVAGNFGGVATIGVVDPFLPGVVRRGERFYLFLYPNTVTSLRHVWQHPAFAVKVPVAKEPAGE